MIEERNSRMVREVRKKMAENAVPEGVQKKKGKKFFKKGKNKIILIGLIAIVVLGIGIYLYNQYRTYTSYRVLQTLEMKTEVESNYDMFGAYTVQYSKDGIALLDTDGKSIWTKSYSMKSPKIVTNETYIVSADLTGNSIYLFDKDGKSQEYTMPYPIEDVEISDQGVIAVVLEDNNKNYIQLYDKEGNKIVDSNVSIEQSGYPLDIALSKDAMNLVVSYVTIDGMEAKSTIAFYNFGSVGQNANSNKYVGGFYYTDTIFPKVEFLDNTTVCAYGDNQAILYQVKNKPSNEEIKIPFDTQVRSIFSNEKYIGFVRRNEKEPENGKYIVDVYNKKGSSVFRQAVDIDYQKVKFDGNEIILIGEYECTILRLQGDKKFYSRFDTGITDVIPIGKRNQYLVVESKSLQRIKLK